VTLAVERSTRFVPAWPGQVCSLGYEVGRLIEGDLDITLAREQQHRVVEYWRLDPLTGRRVNRRAAIRRPKGAGKSPEGAYCGYAELVGPVSFAGWSEDGQPIGAPWQDPWVQFAAVSEDQTDNVMVWLFDTLSGRPDVCRERHIDLGRTRIYLLGRPGRLEPVTAAAGSREGQPIKFAVLDQSESWMKENGGHRLADTLRRNAAKMGGWSLELQNAPLIGDGSVADKTGKASDRRSAGVYFDTREPAGVEKIDMSDPAQLLPALEFAYGESARSKGGWVDLERLVEEILDPDTDPSDAKRYYLNTASPSSDWAWDREKWAQLGDTGLVPQGDQLVVAGFDGARFDDSTGIVCTEVETGNTWLHAVWEKPEKADDGWEIDESEVDRAVADLFSNWRVWRFYCDPPYWESSVASWEAKYRGADRKQAVVPWWTNRWRAVGYACRAVGSAIRGGQIHRQEDDGDDVLLRHVRNAVKRTVNARDEHGKQLWTIAKPAPGRKIDVAMALVLAWEARTDAIAAGVRLHRARVAGFR
jgi:hypothetical protein